MIHCNNKPECTDKCYCPCDECTDAVCNTPTYTHDCEDCRFLGSVTGPHPRNTERMRTTFDLYYCARCDGGTVIARYGSDGSQYASCPVKMLYQDIHPALLWANAILLMESYTK